MDKYTTKELEESSFEYLQCPYCGTKLDRLTNGVIPTSCIKCNKHNIIVNEKKCIILDSIRK